ncbi:MAG: hypothetical protein AUK37_07970 [Rhodobacterales bacterium CG2_30_65_12]|nr:MAG: hypothetical protein AUK37_07970 [Rhodobacterales bacterium CG2_30_65_12]
MVKSVSGVIFMAFALLLLGLLPMMMMFDFSPETDAASDEGGSSTFSGTDQGGDLLSANEGGDEGGDTVRSGLTDPSPLLPPITDDEDPFDGAEVDPEDVLPPITGDEDPFLAEEIDPETVLDPVDEPGDDAPAPGDASPLQSLLGSETGFDAGAGWLGDYGPETDDIALGSDEDLSAPDDGLDGTGLGVRSDYEGTQVLESDNPVQVIAGGDGANTITLGDDSAYAFGGAGDDTITAGEGAAALSGGAGDDALTASDTAAWADGGTGDDTITGGAGADTLLGGAHNADSATVQDDDRIDGGAGDDHIAGGYGADVLIGGDGNDVIDHLGRVEQDYHTAQHEFAWHIDNDADTLDGGSGNDTLIMDRADSATGGAGYDTFWVYFDNASGGGAAEVGDFTPGEDFLRISLNPALDNGDMALSVAPSDDGQDAVVSVNGEIVAMLRGAPGASAADVLVEVSENIFA